MLTRKLISNQRYVYCKEYNTIIIYSKNVKIKTDSLQVQLTLFCSKNYINVLIIDNKLNTNTLINFNLTIEKVSKIVEYIEKNNYLNKIIEYYFEVQLNTPIKRTVIRPK